MDDSQLHWEKNTRLWRLRLKVAFSLLMENVLFEFKLGHGKEARSTHKETT